jgi:hypothetical protein
MVNRNSLHALIDKAEEQYKTCWRILIGTKARPGIESSSEEILQFQPLLCAALFELDHTYREIRAEERRLIGRKSLLAPAWFRTRMKTLATYKRTIEHMIGIGKSLGDAYAWPFYHREPGFLMEHAKQPRQLHLPGGVGGKGEYVFSTRIRPVLGKFPLYHGMTNILRLGDISLIDPERLKVAALGELKTAAVEPDKLAIRLEFIGPRSQDFDVPQASSLPAQTTPPPLSARIATKLQQQMNRMAAAVSAEMRRASGHQLEFEGRTYLAELNEVVRIASPGQFTYRQLDDGLLLIVQVPSRQLV